MLKVTPNFEDCKPFKGASELFEDSYLKVLIHTKTSIHRMGRAKMGKN